MRRATFLFFIGLVISSCLKDRTFNIVSSESDKAITPGIISINEICATGSTYASEFTGSFPDWVELYNPSADTFLMVKGKWFVTDALTLPYKFSLPQIKIPPHKFFVFCCDGLDTIKTQVHTNFSLSNNGEEVGLFYQTDGGPFITVDQHIFGAQTSGVSIGRIPDGSSNWNSCSLMTPGTPNQ